MSVSSIRLQDVSVFKISRTESSLVRLNDLERAYFVIPLAYPIAFCSESGKEITVAPKDMLVCAGHPKVKVAGELNYLGCNDKRSEIDITDIHFFNQSIHLKSNTGILIVSVGLCEPIRNGLKKVLPTYLHLKDLPDVSSASIQNIAQQMLLYDTLDTDTSQAMQDRLTELLFLETIEHYFHNKNMKTGFLKAMTDRRLREALGAIHENPQSRWTVDGLARIASMSRSLFAERFKFTLNETPLNYVRLCRIEKAKQILRDSSASIDQVAQESGYASISSFVKAFAQVTGVTPGSWRDKNR